jgi:hypothetical protein
MLEAYILEVLCSDLGQDMGYPDFRFLWFSSVPQVIAVWNVINYMIDYTRVSQMKTVKKKFLI